MYINPLINPVIERQIQVRGNILKYKFIGSVYTNEDILVYETLKEAFCLVLDAYMSLKNQDTKSIRIATEISGCFNYKTFLSSLEKVSLKILANVLVILRENYLDTENDDVLASIDKDDKKTFTVYDKFFDKVGLKENRAGIFIHEIAHLCDFDEEDEMKELDSAECIKNICLCINGKITLEQIKAEHKKRQQNPQKDRRDGVLTYRPFGSRDPDGRYNSQKDGTSGSGTTSAKSSDGKETSSNKTPPKTNNGRRLRADKLAKEAKERKEDAERMKKDFESEETLNKTINIEDFYKEAGFDPNGIGEKMLLLKDPTKVLTLWGIKNDATDMGIRYASEKGGSTHNDEGDAMRHAFLSWKISNEYGSFYAKQLTDAHEISVPNDDDERAMDLKNNEIGRKASLKYPDLKTDEEIYQKLKELVEKGLLKKKKYVIYK